MLATLVLCPSFTFALAPDLDIRQLYHTGWGPRDGAPAQISALAQGDDGYIWIGALSGLFRFDGVRFEHIQQVGGVALLSDNVTALYPSSEGVWIGYLFGGISLIKAGSLTNYSRNAGLPDATVDMVLKDHSGTLWASTYRGLFTLEGSRWVSVGPERGVSDKIRAFGMDDRGTLWTIDGSVVRFLASGKRRFESTPIEVAVGSWEYNFFGPPDNLQLIDKHQGIRELRLTRDNTLTDAAWRSIRFPEGARLDPSILDRDGQLWFQAPAGIQRADTQVKQRGDTAPISPTEGVVGHSEGLVGDEAHASLEDREGNIWIATNEGLNEFRRSRFVKEYLPHAYTYALAASDDAGMLIATAVPFSLELLAPNKVGTLVKTSLTPPANVPIGEWVMNLYKDRSGTIWLGTKNTIWRLMGSNWVGFTRPHAIDDGTVTGYVQSMAMDADGGLWVSLSGAGVFRIADGIWTPSGGRTDLPAGYATVLASDTAGKLWLGYFHDQVAVLNNGRLVTYSASDGLDVGTVRAIALGPNHTWVGGTRGIERFDGHRFLKMFGKDSFQFGGVSGVVETLNGDIWFSTHDGAVHVVADEVQRFSRDPAYSVQFEQFNYLDGIASGARFVRPVPTIAQSTDGRIWLATNDGVVWTYPEQTKNTVQPIVVVESMTADGTRYEGTGARRLHSDVRNLEIDYTALSFTMPERVKFRYRLEGHDVNWQEVGTRRSAYFADLKPGNYRFRVMASNNDGMWNDAGASIDFLVPPTFIQTRWFLGLCIGIGIALLWLIFRLRIQQINRNLRGRLEERLAERERIARNLHDTLLQGIQGLILRFNHATERIAPSDPARELMEQALEKADLMLAEGRDSVSDLRQSTPRQVDLASALEAHGADLARYHSAQFRTDVEGTPRELRPDVRQESYRIGAEALANAFRHAAAQQILLRVVYDKTGLTVQVKDDGRGFEASDVQATASVGHWGLIGMRERTIRMNGALEIASHLGVGTTVQFKVPSRAAFVATVGRRLLGEHRRLELPTNE